MTSNKLTRRQFLKAAGITLAAATVTCSGLGFAATRAPGIETPELTYGKETAMNDRILVTYATRAGSTAEIAAAVAETLAARGLNVDVKPVKEKPSLKGYRAVILGSAIRMGNWLPEAVDFIKQNQAALQQLPVALFTVHMLNTGDDAESTANRQAYLKAVEGLLEPIDSAYFRGKMDLSRLSMLDRFISKMVKAVDADDRDWDAIRGWAQTVLAQES